MFRWRENWKGNQGPSCEREKSASDGAGRKVTDTEASYTPALFDNGGQTIAPQTLVFDVLPSLPERRESERDAMQRFKQGEMTVSSEIHLADIVAPGP